MMSQTFLHVILIAWATLGNGEDWTKAQEKRWSEYKVNPFYDIPWLNLQKGQSIPQLGMGTYLSNGAQLMESVKFALRLGYRMFDTASGYENSEALAQGISQVGINYRDVFLITKIHPSRMGYESTLEDLRSTLKQLERKNINMCLVHWPGNIYEKDEKKLEDSFRNAEQGAYLRYQTWRALEHAKELGLCLGIGVSNYELTHLNELLHYARYSPAVNELEVHPYFIRDDLLSFCRRNHIVVIAYGSIAPKGFFFFFLRVPPFFFFYKIV
ncbi:aldo-keto reductase [Reticulomyxa filosa]|uniref:Aldo-keto reductase n=1 Tax=Reticulomyxa filosa TaxID=46433 RepID=X6NDE1_RETFI|nr:aldo-keto reductase [Reticulomyxa filosa]|eukprot:ETO23883.1 aldo-keto reductase [Reticulomyxa filosa]